jgi:tRNA dimethylallyltransferase
MMEQGALDEVRSLRGIGGELPAARALGVPSLLAHLEGRLTRDQAVEQAITQTRQYAKRQMTWFRHQMPDWAVIERSSVEEAVPIIAQMLE